MTYTQWRVRWQRLPLAGKLNLSQAIVLIVLMTAATWIQVTLLSQALETRNVQQLTQLNQALMHAVTSFGDGLTQQAEQLGTVFSTYFPETFRLENTAAGPVLHQGDRILNNDPSDVERFSRATGGVATILMRQGDNFLRIATSIQQENGTSVTGTLLDPAHPSRVALLRGEMYTDKTNLFGRDYMTNYRPLKDSSGQVIGALFVGFDFTKALKNLRQDFLNNKIGDTGYPYILERSGQNRGAMIMHPLLEGKNLLDIKDPAGKLFIREMLDTGQGILRYYWQDKNETAPRLKVVAYATYPRWNWVLASGSYLDEFTHEAETLRYQSFAVIAVTVALLLGLLLINTHRWITRPLLIAVQLNERIVAGDLTVQPPPHGSDEIGRLLAALGRMVEGLRTTIIQINQAANHLVADARNMTESSNEVANSSAEQSDAATSMAASLEQMTRSINMVSQHANEARQLSSQSGQVSEHGAQVMHQTVTGMARIAETVKQASTTVEQLWQQSEAISAIVSTIKSIAEQTNLLALNAAIEAARAGEQGRGFAVVADEVKKLATRTATATQEISAMIVRIQTGTQEAVRGMETGVQLVEQGAQLASAAGQSVGDIQSSAQQVVAAVTSISQALQEQNSAGVEIAQNVERIADQASSNSRRSKSAAQAALNLQHLAQKLNDSIRQFQTG